MNRLRLKRAGACRHAGEGLALSRLQVISYEAGCWPRSSVNLYLHTIT